MVNNNFNFKIVNNTRLSLAGVKKYKSFISDELDVTSIAMNGTEEFIILGCDGLWDTITPDEATKSF